MLGRLVNLVMSLGIIWCVGEMARQVAGARAGLLAAIACALNFGLTYYGQVSNLDVPYLFWACLALLWCMRAVAEQEPRRFWLAALFAAAAVATKDQAYAPVPVELACLPVCFGLQRMPGRARTPAGLRWSCWRPRRSRCFLLLLVDGAITNPSGFVRRIAFLAGPASQDYAQYLHGPSGWLALLGDMGSYFAQGYGLTTVTLAMLGVGVHMLRSRDRVRVAGLLPLLAIISFTLCFNFAALRSDDRFLLPQAVLSCVYIGIVAEVLVFPVCQPGRGLAGRGVLVLIALAALHQAVAINAAFLFDPRYDAERWMSGACHAGRCDRNLWPELFPAALSESCARDPGRAGQSRSFAIHCPASRKCASPSLRRAIRASLCLALPGRRRYLKPAIPLGPGHIYSRLHQADFDQHRCAPVF